jgi:peroxiredoxin Q/BCP
LIDGCNPPAIDSLAPDFTLSRRTTSRSSFPACGQWVVLYFYPKDFTSGLRWKRTTSSAVSPNTKNDAVILGVCQDQASHKQFCTKED